MEALLGIGVLGTPVGILLLRYWNRWSRWRAAYWTINGHYEYRGMTLKVGVRRRFTRKTTAEFRPAQADSEEFAVALAEAKQKASALNAASRTVAA